MSSPQDHPSPLSPSGLTEAEIAEQLARADGTLGAAGHYVSDPESREIMRQQVAGEITGDQARAQLIANARAAANGQSSTGRA